MKTLLPATSPADSQKGSQVLFDHPWQPAMAEWRARHPRWGRVQSRPSVAITLVAMLGCHHPHQQEPIPPPVIEIGAPATGRAAVAQTPPPEAMRVIAGGTYEVAPRLKVPESWVDCDTEDDCTIVEAGCCNHCNGGVITAVNTKFAKKLRPLLERFGCAAGGSGCAARSCDAPTDHEIVCMTRACIIVDLEPEVQDALWGAQEANEDEDIVEVEAEDGAK
jgi:hypothetical protein